jgi:hypothetical protein
MKNVNIVGIFNAHVYGVSVDKEGYAICCRPENNWLFNGGAQFMFFNIYFFFHLFTLLSLINILREIPKQKSHHRQGLL